MSAGWFCYTVQIRSKIFVLIQKQGKYRSCITINNYNTISINDFKNTL